MDRLLSIHIKLWKHCEKQVHGIYVESEIRLGIEDLKVDETDIFSIQNHIYCTLQNSLIL